MTDYTKLVEALRCCEFGWSARTCDNCEYSKTDCQLLLSDAADAIEALQSYIKRLKEANDELRERQTYIDRYGTEWLTSAKDVPNYAYEHGYADGMAEVKAQLPKRGEWQKAKPKGVVTYSDGYAECSHCHKAIWLGWWMNFCPHCGTQNKIIDPDDYDGAKMTEVQDGQK